jgi:5'-3' exonuclease
LAGVVGLTKFFRRKGSKAWKSSTGIQPVKTDHLCIDMNQLLHTSVRTKVRPTLLQCLRKIYFELDSVMKYVMPSKSLVLVFDGPAPFAKLQTQRSRRTLSPGNNIITPGTDFMALMETFMLGYIFQRIHKFSNVSVYISGANSPGEGEIKIIDWVTNHVCHRNETVVICGSDSDILLQAIILSKLSNITVFHRGTEYGSAFCNITAVIEYLSNMANLTETSEPKSVDPIREIYLQNTTSDKYQLLPALLHMHRISINSSKIGDEWKFGSYLKTAPPSFQVDLLVLCVMQGNDYLPKVRGITIEKTLAAYGKVMKLLPTDKRYLVDSERNTFNYVALYLLMSELRCDTVQLHVNLPHTIDCMNALIQRKLIQCDMIWKDKCICSINDTECLWSTELVINNCTYTSGEEQFKSKVAARKHLALLFLKEHYPYLLDDMYEKRKRGRETLHRYQQSVILEERDQLQALRELSSENSGIWAGILEQYDYYLSHYEKFSSQSSSISRDKNSYTDSESKVERLEYVDKEKEEEIRQRFSKDSLQLTDRDIDDNSVETEDNSSVSEEGYARYVR